MPALISGFRKTFRSRTSGASATTSVSSEARRREKSRSWAVSAAARSDALAISRTQVTTRASSPGLRSASRAKPPMAVSMLLNSWAIPPAMRPTASIFCERWSSASARRRSVTSFSTSRTAGSRW